jgi:hypothetical protein
VKLAEITSWNIFSTEPKSVSDDAPDFIIRFMRLNTVAAKPQKAEDEDGEEEEEAREELEKKFGVGGVNRPVLKPQNRDWFSYCPLHLAVNRNHIVRYNPRIHLSLKSYHCRNA